MHSDPIIVEAINLKTRLLNSLIIQTRNLLLEKNQTSLGTLKNYEKNGFKRVQKFFSQNHSVYYSNRLIDCCIKSAWDEHQMGIKSIHQFQVLRKAALLLREVYETNSMQWHMLPAWNTKILPVEVSSILSDYLVTITGTCCSTTIQSKKNIIRQFLFFLEDDGLTKLSRFSSKNLLNYLEFIVRHRPSSMGAIIPTIRSFLLFLNTQKIIAHDYTFLLSMNSTRRSTIKPIFSEGEPEKILSIIDRTCNKGKRDFAMLMLARHNGLRSSDILNLKLSDIKWKEAEILIIQKKTGRALTCPINNETGNALADYILNARPVSSLSYVFLKLYSPYNNITSSASLCELLKHYMSIAGVSEPGRWKSVHTFRRTLGTRMLEANVPLTTISQVLGQQDRRSSKAYLSLSEKKLSECPLNLNGFEVKAEGLR